MSSIGEHTEASSSESELGRIRDNERPSTLSDVVVALRRNRHQTDAARTSLMAAAVALLEYASVGRTNNDRESVQYGSAGKTEAIELGDRGRLQYFLFDGNSNVYPHCHHSPIIPC